LARTASGKIDNRRADIEAVLTEHGIEFTYAPTIALDQIQRHDELQSRLRIDNKQLVGEYKEKMSRGAIFPPVVLQQNADGTYSSLDGHTRIEAKRLKKEAATDAYIVEVADANQAVYISAIFNASHGMRLSKQEIRRAVVAAKSMLVAPPNERLAADYGVSLTTVGRIWNSHRVTTELEAAGIDTALLNDNAKQQLAKVSDVSVKRDLARLVMDSDMQQAELTELVKAINGKGSEADRLGVVEQARADRAEEIAQVKTGRPRKSRPTSQSATVFGRVLQLMGEFPNPADWVPVDEDRRKEMKDRVDRATAFLDRVRDAYIEESSAAVAGAA
jgi:hypothetical protein